MFRTLPVLLICALLAALLIAQTQPGADQRTRTLLLREGRAVSGQISRTEGGYQVATPNGVMVYRDQDVLELIDAPSLEAQFGRSREGALLDVQQHLSLGQWAMRQGLLWQAREEFRAALCLQPNSAEAARLLDQVQIQLRVIGPQVAPVGPASQPTAAEQGISDDWLIGEDDINRIRLAELRLGERVNVRFREDVLRRFVQFMYGKSDFTNPAFERTFYRYDAVRQALYMRDHLERVNPSMLDDVRIDSDVEAITRFRRDVWPVIGATCASAACHGGPAPLGGLKLFNVPDRPERSLYTNFAILDGLVIGAGYPQLIDRANINQSLLLQYGLPPDLADYHHPPALRPAIYPSRGASPYQRVATWIRSLGGPSHPIYRVEYRPPLGMQLDYSSPALRPQESAPPTPAPAAS